MKFAKSVHIAGVLGKVVESRIASPDPRPFRSCQIEGWRCLGVWTSLSLFKPYSHRTLAMWRQDAPFIYACCKHHATHVEIDIHHERFYQVQMSRSAMEIDMPGQCSARPYHQGPRAR